MNKYTLQKLIALAAALWIGISGTAQTCPPGNRFSEQTVCDYDSIRDIPYTQPQFYQETPATLRMDVYLPLFPNGDPLAQRPFVLLIHGGGFQIGGRQQFREECRMFARRGYVAATIDYRLGYECAQGPDEYNKAVYRAVQDARAALRFAASNASNWAINTNWFFIGGASAGAGTALSVIYLSQAEANADFPSIVQNAGPLNAVGNPLTNTYTIRAVYNNWGGIPSSYVSAAESVPMVAFHGDADQTVNIDSEIKANCPGSAPRVVVGSRGLQNILAGYGVCYDLTVKPGGGHGVYRSSLQQIEFRVARASCFFRSIFCNTCTSFYATSTVIPDCSPALRLTGEAETPVVLPVAYPNPVADRLTLSAPTGQPVMCRIFNTAGQCVLEVSTTREIDCSSLSEGAYVLMIADAEKTTPFRFVKLR
ncbi:MAG: carboxylesterase family protein [Bacteroidetes bacterium]|nr:carboxylesterase family protein [Bacteroidota bacterium]